MADANGLRSASVRIDDRSIDALNLANLRRRVNRSLVIQEARQPARIKGDALVIDWRYAGYCRAKQETVIEFSVDSEADVPFDALECFASDLGRDPNRCHKIRPLLLSPDGLSKKLALPMARLRFLRQRRITPLAPSN